MKFSDLAIGIGIGLAVALALVHFSRPQAARLPRALPVAATYENDEEWELIRDERDRVVGVRAKRRAVRTA